MKRGQILRYNLLHWVEKRKLDRMKKTAGSTVSKKQNAQAYAQHINAIEIKKQSQNLMSNEFQRK